MPKNISKFNVPISRTYLLDEEIVSVSDVLRSGWLVQGSKVEEFEEIWSEFTGAKYSIAVNSGTSALYAAVCALGVEPGDEVIVPAFTWVATANIVEQLGAKVVFCDIELDSFNIDIVQLHENISTKTKGILPGHIFGQAANMPSINRIADECGLWVVEDAACGFGTFVEDKHVGTFGNAGCFSFHPRKSITTGEGGMITTQNLELAAKLRSLRNHGAVTTELQERFGHRPYLLADHAIAGHNFRMTDFQGALGSAQMKRAKEILAERYRLASIYDEAFAGVEWLKFPKKLLGCRHSYQSYACIFQPEPISLRSIDRINKMRNSVMYQLHEAGVSTRPATHAVHMLSYYKNKYALAPEDYLNAYTADHCSFSLPLFVGMTSHEQEYVIEKLIKLKL